MVMVSDGKISTEKIIKDEYKEKLDQLSNEYLSGVSSHEEFAVMDKAHRIQLSEELLQLAGIDSERVRVEVKDGKIIISK